MSVERPHQIPMSVQGFYDDLAPLLTDASSNRCWSGPDPCYDIAINHGAGFGGIQPS